jgi:lipopolysaccharide/colanic/teichoic acid biosynthesis glycosyltransferase
MWKKVFDVTLASVLLIASAPLFLGVAVLIWWRLGPPVFFLQERPGSGGRPFQIVKFRTMREAHDAEGRLLPDEERMPRLGQFLRHTSLDELPELWNVLKGDMSLVGPRPLLMEYLPLYSPEQARRHEVRPGITGWAQVNGRNDLSWEDKFRLDVWYVDNRSFRLDLRILGLTLLRVLEGSGVNKPGWATTDRFRGSAS